MPPQQQQDDFASSFLDSGSHYVELIVRAWAVSVEVFTRRDFGSRYLGVQAGAALILIPVYCLACPPDQLMPMWWFFIAYMGMCVLHRLSMAGRARQRSPEHTGYPGRPRLMRLFRNWQEMNVKKFAEPVVFGGLAIGIGSYTAALGVYLLIGIALSLGLTCQAQAELRRRAEDMHDGALEQEFVVQKFRDMRGDY